MAAPTIPQNFNKYTLTQHQTSPGTPPTYNPRNSAETDHRHLLDPTSIPPSTATSIYAPSTTDDGERTPRAHSPAPLNCTLSTPTSQPQTYRGFPSEAAYLAALSSWAEEKKYIRYPTELKGFYGTVTADEYANRPRVELGVSKGIKDKWRARKERRASKKDIREDEGVVREVTGRGARRNTVT